MSITTKLFGTLPDGRNVTSYLLENKSGVKAEILDYGCIIRRIIVPDKNNNPVDVVLGRETIEEYLTNDGYLGAVIGRNSNRLANSEFELNGKIYKLNPNNGKNNLHGGLEGFNKKLWETKIIDNGDEPEIVFSLSSPDGEEGFPGNAEITVTYTLTKENGLKLHYTASADRDTVMNLTNHSYFNLNGHASGKNIHNLKLQLNSDFFTPNTDECMPNGEILSVSGSKFDFRAEKPVGQDICDTETEQLAMFDGYDHNFILSGKGFRKFGHLYCEENGIIMDCYTDLPGVQLYTGNCLAGDRTCKDGVIYKKHDALCLETQFFPNAFSFNHFPSIILKKGDVYDSTTEYRFSIR